jgi:uncharacterized small protein (TIGR04563 family)
VAPRPSRRQALYFPQDMLEELQREARRLDRSTSWLIQQAWKIARSDLRRMPSTTDFLPRADDDLPKDGSGEDSP